MTWASVLLELLIVTLGVLLAFQIEQWAQSRREVRSERLFLGRLWDETETDLAEATALRDEHRRFAGQILEASRRLASGGDLAALPGGEYGCGSVRLPQARYVQGAYAELVAGDKFQLVRDAPLRHALREALGARRQADGQLAYNRQNSGYLLERLAPYQRLTPDPQEPEMRCRMDWFGLAGDPVAKQALMRGYRQQQLMAEARADEAATLQAVKAQLACALDRPECRRGSSR